MYDLNFEMQVSWHIAQDFFTDRRRNANADLPGSIPAPTFDLLQSCAYGGDIAEKKNTLYHLYQSVFN